MIENNSKSKFIKGALAGVVLGVAAGLFLNSKKGKQLQKDVQDHLADFYAYISPKIKKIERMGKKEYEEFMEKAVEQYKKTKNISADIADKIKEQVIKSFDYFADSLREEKDK